MNNLTSAAARAQGNESKIRLVAFGVFCLAIIYWVTKSVWVPVFLVLDFILRSFDMGRFSPLAIAGEWTAKKLKLPFKPVYMPPKRFAARIGLIFSVTIVILHLLQINTLAPVVIIVFFAALESFAGFCAGCYVYDFLLRVKILK